MLSMIVTVRVKPGREADYARIAGDFGRLVEAERPGAILFRTYPTDDPLVFITIEHFEDEKALAFHQAHDGTKEKLEELADILDGGLQVQKFTEEV